MRRIYARNCVVAELDIEPAEAFLKDHHRDGFYSASKRRTNLGLFHKDELLGVAIFDTPRTQGKQRDYTDELYRLAFKKDVRVVGGASKLIKTFIREYDPIALFTYQSTQGEKTDVYEKSGMRLVSKAKDKEVLVSDDSGAKRKEVSLQQALQWGPDRLIGTKLGTVTENGKRVNNIELFLRSGYHLERRPGDRVYEWLNPNVTHYLYKITSKIDDGYYIGRHTVRGSQSKEECLNDGYWGSGGDKFKNWIAKVGKENLVKEILGIYPTRKALVKAEKKAIGELYKTKSCKNTKPGGVGNAAYGFPKSQWQNCEKHGKTKYIGDSCRKCIAASYNLESVCDKHGKTWFKGKSCNKCTAEKANHVQFCNDCKKETKHIGDHCATCLSQSSVSIKFCETCQRETKHQGDTCSACSAAAINVQKYCNNGHGLTWHKGDSCNKCAAESAQNKRYCKVCEEETNHLGERCSRCLVTSGLEVRYCGDCRKKTTHRSKSGACVPCSTRAINSKGYCEKGHGLTWFKGSSCAKCSSQKAFVVLTCEKHGEVKHQSGNCCVCTAESANSTRECSKHGNSKHIGDKCRRCVAEDASEKRFQAKLAELSTLGFDELGLEKAFKSLSQTKLVELINREAGKSLVSRPALKRVLEFYKLL